MDDDCADDDTADWQKVDCTLVFDTDHYEIEYAAATQKIRQSVNQATAYPGQEVMLSVDVKDGSVASQAGDLRLCDDGYAATYIQTFVTTAAWQTITLTAYPTTTKDQLGLTMNIPSGNIEIRNASIKLIGAVALYGQSSISDSEWKDLAGGNHGAVTGASVLNYKGAHSDGVDLFVDRKVIQPTTVTAETTAATLTIAELLTGIITGTHTVGGTAAYTLPTGTLSDAGVGMAVNDSFDWVLINLSAAEADTITVTAGTAHTIVGNAVVLSSHSNTIASSSAQFRTVKSAANTMVTYRIA
jgi:hypothetical protein